MNGYQSTIDRIREAVKHIKITRDLLANGPLDYYLEKLACHSDALLERFAPIKRNGRAVIAKKIKCTGGWLGCERTLAVGSVGVVHEVDYQDGQFEFTFVPDVQWRKDLDGNWVEKTHKHSYLLREEFLVAINDLVSEPVADGITDDTAAVQAQSKKGGE